MAKRNAARDAIGASPQVPASAAATSASEAASETATARVVPLAKPAPTKEVGKFMLYAHPKVLRKVKEIAFVEERKMNDVVLEALDRYLTAEGHRGIKYVIEN